MADASQGGQEDDYQEASIPSPRPVYSTKDYSNQRQTSPPPPPPPPSAVRDRVRKRRMNKRNSASEWVWVIVAGTLFAVVLVVSFGALVIVNASNTSTVALPTADVALPTAVVARNDFDTVISGDTLLLDDGSSIILEPWDGESRFTMILVGLDRRPGETGLTYRTDTMMLVSIDPVANTIGVLSLPRDTYVAINGYASRQRINSAMVLGEIQQPGNGPTLMRRTISRNFGITVHDFVAVDFQAFIDVVDAVGGVEITSSTTINDPQYPGMNYDYDPFYLPAGTHFLDGYDTLRYARTRHGSSDISRAERQQQVIYALRDRVLDLDMIPTLIARAPALWASWQDNVYTGLTLEQMIQLGLYVKDVPRENITMDVLDYQYLQSWETPEGAQVLIPNVSRLPQLMTGTFGADYNQ